MSRRVLAVAAALLLAVTGCSGDAQPEARGAGASPTAVGAVDTTGTPAGNRWWLRTDPERGDRSLDLWVHEQACASGRLATGRIRPVVDYADDSITVTITVAYAGGDQTCPGNPDTPYTLTLEQPVGSREVKDGGTTPPTRKDPPA
jgi:hypothetical protein